MAIAFSSVSNQDSGSYVVPAGNPIVFFGITGSILTDDVTGASIGGQAMTLVDKVLNPGTNGRYCYLFVLQNPPVGSQTVATTGGATSDGWVISYVNTLQTGQVDAHGTNTAIDNSTDISKSLTSTVDSCWMVGFADGSNGNLVSAGSNTIARGTPTNSGFFDSNSSISPAGPYTLNVSNSSAGLAFLCATFKPSIGSGATLLLGNAF